MFQRLVEGIRIWCNRKLTFPQKINRLKETLAYLYRQAWNNALISKIWHLRYLLGNTACCYFPLTVNGLKLMLYIFSGVLILLCLTSGFCFGYWIFSALHFVFWMCEWRLYGVISFPLSKVNRFVNMMNTRPSPRGTLW